MGRGEVDALGQGALDGGIMGGSRVPVEQARLLNQVHAVGVCAAGEKKIFFLAQTISNMRFVRIYLRPTWVKCEG